MKTYRVWVCLECEYNDIDAENEEKVETLKAAMVELGQCHGRVIECKKCGFRFCDPTAILDYQIITRWNRRADK